MYQHDCISVDNNELSKIGENKPLITVLSDAHVVNALNTAYCKLTT